MSEYIIIKNLHADDVNFEQNFSVIGNFPAITSFLGFVHAIFRKINGLNDIAVCPVLHNLEMYKGIEKHIPDLDKIKTGSGASLVPSIKGSVDFSLIIEVNSSQYTRKESIIDDVQKAIIGLTLSGGVIKFNDHIEESIIYAINSNFEKYVSTIPTGKIVSDATELLFYPNSLEDKMDELIDIVSIKKDEDGNILPNKYEGYLLPIAIGYASLENITKREGRNGVNDHCYVESVIGLGEILHFSKKRIRKVFTKKVFWYYNYAKPDKNKGSFLCSGYNKY